MPFVYLNSPKLRYWRDKVVAMMIGTLVEGVGGGGLLRLNEHRDGGSPLDAVASTSWRRLPFSRIHRGPGSPYTVGNARCPHHKVAIHREEGTAAESG
jgi:hypothetical protein